MDEYLLKNSHDSMGSNFEQKLTNSNLKTKKSLTVGENNDVHKLENQRYSLKPHSRQESSLNIT